ncbi:MAG: DUF2018 family protein [Calditrichaeota bacterium]|nr:DUF2018 family protein [Calditrichota bacterium]
MSTTDRVERDRLLFRTDPHRQLVDTLRQANPVLTAEAIKRAIELQIIAEEMARRAGVEIDEGSLTRFLADHKDEIDEQVSRALTAFICAIVSQEG